MDKGLIFCQWLCVKLCCKDINFINNCRGGDRHCHDLTRRNRHQSGMALPAISDSFDAFELLGLDRNEASQVRYCNHIEFSLREIVQLFCTSQIFDCACVKDFG